MRLWISNRKIIAVVGTILLMGEVGYCFLRWYHVPAEELSIMRQTMDGESFEPTNQPSGIPPTSTVNRLKL
jgi:hypothetical protein